MWNTTRSRPAALAIMVALAAMAAAATAATQAGQAHSHASSWRPVTDDEGVAPRPAVENTPAVEATFLRESYAPGTFATLVLWRPEGALTLQVLQSGPEQVITRSHIDVRGVPMGPPTTVAPHEAHAPIRVAIGGWPSGLYFARLEAADGRVGFAPFIVRPSRLGTNHVLVVLPTYTWQAYNFRDDNGDGRGDTWYAGWKQNWANLARPYLDRGVPPHFCSYDLPFLNWLAQSGKQVDFFADSDLGAVASAAALARAYRLIVFPGHHEYVTTREYDLVTGYRDLGGHLMFLSANNFFRRIDLRGNRMILVGLWRDLGRPEAALIGVQYRGNDEGQHKGPWIVRNAEAEPWLFAGTGLHDGMPLGIAGTEIDKTAAASPKNVRVIADIRNLLGPGFTAQMTYYQTPAGAEVFAAGAFTLAGSMRQPLIQQLAENLWNRLA
jgi:hypothetical protein